MFIVHLQVNVWRLLLGFCSLSVLTTILSRLGLSRLNKLSPVEWLHRCYNAKSNNSENGLSPGPFRRRWSGKEFKSRWSIRRPGVLHQLPPLLQSLRNPESLGLLAQFLSRMSWEDHPRKQYHPRLSKLSYAVHSAEAGCWRLARQLAIDSI